MNNVYDDIKKFYLKQKNIDNLKYLLFCQTTYKKAEITSFSAEIEK